MTDPFLFIAHSYRNDMIPWQHAATLEAMEKPGPYCHGYEGHLFDIGRSRNLHVKLMLSMSQTTHILFVDDDIIIPRQDSLMKMYDWITLHDKAIISGLYWDKRVDSGPLILGCEQKQSGKIIFGFPYRNVPPPRNSIIKVGAVPAGFLLVKREVFEKIPPPWFVLNAPQFQHDEEKKDSHIMGEDIYFSLKARQHGYELYVDTRASLVHVGSHYYGEPDMVNMILRTSDMMTSQAEQVEKQFLEKKQRCHTKEIPNARNAAGCSNANPHC